MLLYFYNFLCCRLLELHATYLLNYVKENRILNDSNSINVQYMYSLNNNNEC